MERRTVLSAPFRELALLIVHRELVDVSEERQRHWTRGMSALDAPAVSDICAEEDQRNEQDGGR